MKDIRELVGDRIRILRKNLNLSQEALAFKADLDRTYVASVENGKRNISIINIEKLALALNCSLYDFFNSEEFKTISQTQLTQVAERKRRYNTKK